MPLFLRSFGILALAGLIALASAGCRNARPGRVPTSGPTAAVVPSEVRAGVVDLTKVAKVHPRWKEMEALAKRIQRVQAQIEAPPVPPPVVGNERLRQQLEAQARALEAEFKKELQALREFHEAELSRAAADSRARQETVLDEQKQQVEAELRKTIDTRARALQEELRRYELQVMEDYRYPLANLRLKADVVGLSNEEELKRMTEEIERLQDERDARVRARATALDATLNDFQRAKTLEAEAKLIRLKAAAEAAVRRTIETKRRELQAENDLIARQREKEFKGQLAQVRQRIVGVAEDQVRQAQERYLESLRQREQQLIAEQQALNEQRVRLEDAILAEVKIEVATIAAQRGLDVVLTRYALNLKMTDITQAVIARLKK